MLKSFAVACIAMTWLGVVVGCGGNHNIGGQNGFRASTSSTTTTTSSTGATGGSSAGSGSTAAPSTLPTPPANSVVFTNVQNFTSGWGSCSDCAGGGSVTTNYWMAQYQTSPSLSGSSAQFFNGGQAWANVLWYNKLGAQNAATHFLWDFYVYFDSTTATNVWSAEYDLWQSVGGYEHMIGSQCDFGDGVWDTWDQLNGRWIHTNIACNRFTPNTWHHIQWYVERVSATQYRYDVLVVDGVSYAVNQTYTASVSNWNDNLGVQWQLDVSGNGTPAYQWVDNVKLTVW